MTSPVVRVKMDISDVSLFLAFPVLLVRRLSIAGKFAHNPIRIPVAAYLTVCVVSTIAAGAVTQSITSMLQMAMYLVVAVFVFANCVSDLNDVY